MIYFYDLPLNNIIRFLSLGDIYRLDHFLRSRVMISYNRTRSVFLTFYHLFYFFPCLVRSIWTASTDVSPFIYIFLVVQVLYFVSFQLLSYRHHSLWTVAGYNKESFLHHSQKTVLSLKLLWKRLALNSHKRWDFCAEASVHFEICHRATKLTHHVRWKRVNYEKSWTLLNVALLQRENKCFQESNKKGCETLKFIFSMQRK